MKKYLKYLFLLGVFVFLWANFRVHQVSKDYTSDSMKHLPKTKVGLILGTAPTLRNGQPNLYFTHRIQAAKKLFDNGCVKHFLISGDNSSKYYNEPQAFKKALMEKGVPENAITLDYAGFDTYDSMIRAKKVFGQNKFIVISQEFQNKRAVYIARKFGVEAYGFNAKDVKKWGGIKTKSREYLARVKAWCEVLLGVEPTFLGKKIKINP